METTTTVVYPVRTWQLTPTLRFARRVVLRNGVHPQLVSRLQQASQCVETGEVVWADVPSVDLPAEEPVTLTESR